ncbi:MAG: response regulator [Chloroflexota bacterium]
MVDDDPAIREMLAELLAEEGYDVSTASDGGEAIGMVAMKTPDAMLLDLAMPGIDGYGVLDYLRANGLQSLPVMVFSAHRPGPAILEALNGDLRDFISKPFELDELLLRIQHLLKRVPPKSTSGRLSVYCLGSIRVYRDDRLLFDESWRNKPAKTIFKLLFDRAGQLYPKDVLAEQLWPEAEPDAAANRLRVAVHELRKMFDQPARDHGDGYIRQQGGAYCFDAGTDFWSDVNAFGEAVLRGKEMAAGGKIAEALVAYSQGEALYHAEYLRDDPFSEWAVATRERLREEHLDMLAEVAQLHGDLGNPGQAATYCRKIVRIEPWREQTYRRLMEYLVRAGRPHEALRGFEECRRALLAEVDAEPSEETVRLRNRINRDIEHQMAINE